VPGTSQKAVSHQEPRDGLNRWAAGHTDPHSALGTTALAGVLAAKEAMNKYGLKGTLKIFGEPAEKVCGSKPVHAAWGYFNDHNASICYHPSAVNTALKEFQMGAFERQEFQMGAFERLATKTLLRTYRFRKVSLKRSTACRSSILKAPTMEKYSPASPTMWIQSARHSIRA
jgi:hypothetical protein